MRDEELIEAIREVRDRVRARYPYGSLGTDGIAAPDLMPLLHARDAAEAKVAAIGTVNPRPPGFKNSLIQRLKRAVARALDWHVREQVEFNRAVLNCLHATVEALNENNRAFHALAQLHDHAELKDVRAHWLEWRAAFEERQAANEIHVLRTISDLQGAFRERTSQIDSDFRVLVDRQHKAIRSEYEKLIHAELRLIRQRTSLEQVVPDPRPTAVSAPVNPGARPTAGPGTAVPPVDWMRFAEYFRGPEEQIREHQKMYVAQFSGATEVLDLGCGRGEFLEAAVEAGLAARGIDQSAECVAICRSKSLDAQQADLFSYLAALPDRSLPGVYCSQVVEHLEPTRLPELVDLLARKMQGGALLAIETPNPDCLAIFATYFYLDPTHTRPVPSKVLRFYLEEAGFTDFDVRSLSPAVSVIPSLAELPAGLRESLFGGLDYAIFARKIQ